MLGHKEKAHKQRNARSINNTRRADTSKLVELDVDEYFDDENLRTALLPQTDNGDSDVEAANVATSDSISQQVFDFHSSYEDTSIELYPTLKKYYTEI